MEPTIGHELQSDSNEVTQALDYLSVLTERKLSEGQGFKPMILGFYFVKGKVAVIPLATGVLDIVWENPTLQQQLYNRAYQELHEERLTNLAIIFPTMMYSFPDKEKLLSRLKKPAESLTTSDYRALMALYPEDVKGTMAIQFFLDIGGDFQHAYAEIRNGRMLTEYAVCSGDRKTPIIPMLKLARDKVLC